MFGHKKAKDEFEILFKENYNKLYVFAYNYLNDKEISEDVVNDAFEYVWRNYDNLKNNSLVPVLFQQVRHRSFNYLRHNKIVESYFNQKKYSEVAQMLNISTNTVKKHIMKALSSLREELSVSVNGKDS